MTSREITQGDLDEFALISGDYNPIHVDTRYAADTPFEVPVAHGMFLFALVTAELQRRELATPLKGFSLKFPTPTPVGARVKVLIDQPSGAGCVRAQVVKEDGTPGLRGEFALTSPTNLPGEEPSAGAAEKAGGLRHEEKRTFTNIDFARYERLSGESCENTVPTGLIAATVSKILGMDLPGEGTNYLKQHLALCGEAMIGEELVVAVEVARIVADKRLVYLNTACTGEGGRMIAHGQALVLARWDLPRWAAWEAEVSQLGRTAGARPGGHGEKGEAS